MEHDIAIALCECQKYAKKGYDIALDSWNKLHVALVMEEDRINAADRRQDGIKRLENAEILKRQKRNLVVFKRTDEELKQDLDKLHKQQAEFSVLVFGRSMVGKSTLMEILIHGDGKSIGKGAQRTTRDVRDYHWQGMKVTDVPGIGSFDGREDDRLALEAAKEADLVLFLITDDGVQQEEARQLAELRRLGKSVLGIINVKSAITEQVSSFDLKLLRKKMSEKKRIEDICNQFRQFSDSYQQDWEHLTFLPVHLKAAYIGQRLNDERLWQLSNFAEIERYILEKVQRDGCFLRIKTFIDRVVVPLQERMEMLFNNSGENIMEALAYRRKWQDLEEWQKGFRTESWEKHKELDGQLDTKLTSGIYNFAQSHYEDKNVGKAWKDYLQKELRLDEACKDFLRKRADKFHGKQQELNDSLRTELNFFSLGGNFNGINTEEITDTQFWADFLSGCVFLINPVVGIITGILGNFLLDSKDKKIQRARKELRKQLFEVTKPYKEELLTQVWRTFHRKLFDEGINGLRSQLSQMEELLFTLAAKESESGKKLNNMIGELNRKIWLEADKYLHGNDKNVGIVEIIRLPGEIVQVYVRDIPSESYKEDMSKLLGEKIIWVKVSGDADKFDFFIRMSKKIIGKWEGKYLKCGNDRKVYNVRLLEKSRPDILKNPMVRLAYHYLGEPITE